jgi:hypothetical protein
MTTSKRVGTAQGYVSEEIKAMRQAEVRRRQELKHAVDALFEALLDVRLDIALEALAHVEQEFRQAQREPDVLSVETVR